MKKATVAALCAMAALSLLPGLAVAEDAENTVAVEIVGKNVNLLKTLCGDEAPEADEALAGLNVLRVKEITDAEGNAVEGFAGKTLHYLPVATASALIAGDANADKTIVAKGVLHKNVMVIQVKEFEVKESDGDDLDDLDDWDDWDELGVTTMSQQQVI